MASTTIPNLPMAISVSGAEQMEIVQSGVSRRVTLAQITAFTQNGQIVFPSYTTAQKLALSAIVGGAVFDTTLNKVSVFTGSSWETVASGVISGGIF